MRAIIKMRFWAGAFTVLPCAMAMIALGAPHVAIGQELKPGRRSDGTDTAATSAVSTSARDANLIELRDEVRALRQDVQRLLQLLESHTARTNRAEPKDSRQNNRVSPAKSDTSTAVLLVKTYAAADLVEPMTRVVRTAVDDRSAAVPIAAAAHADFDSLEELIMTKVAPDSWERAGGNATIQRFPNNLSLVICQTQANHERIAELFEKLRRGHERIILQTQIIIEAQTERLGLTLSRQKPRVLSAHDAKTLVKRAQSDRQMSLIQSPVIAVPSCQVANIRLPIGDAGEMDLLIRADVDNDSRAIRLGFVVNAQDAVEALRSNASIVVPKGQTVVIDLTDRLTQHNGEQDLSLSARLGSAEIPPTGSGKASRTLVMVTPVIEQEELLGIPSTP